MSSERAKRLAGLIAELIDEVIAAAREDPPLAPLLYTLPQAAKLLNISVGHLYRQRQMGRITFTKIGDRSMVAVEAIHQLLAQIESEPPLEGRHKTGDQRLQRRRGPAT
jgi:excisionase family DNA binding protein